MTVEHVWDEPAGQATFEMANLRPETTGLPFVVFISQKGGAQHDVRVKVSPGPKIIPSQMGTYAPRPFRYEDGTVLSSYYETLLKHWIELNYDVLVDYWNGDISYTEDAISRILKLP